MSEHKNPVEEIKAKAVEAQPTWNPDMMSEAAKLQLNI